ncbi:MAG: hypothetical protein ABIG96_00605 [Candidatus Micrarchaeota archaeon]
MLYISTGRKPSVTTRKLARLLSLILNAKYENRGKRSVDDVCERAEKSGCSRIAFIYEKKGNPSSIQFFDSEKGWLKEEFIIAGVVVPEFEKRKRIPQQMEVKSDDENGKKIIRLLGLEESDEFPSPLHGIFSGRGMEFLLNNEKILFLKGKLIESPKTHD